MVILFAIDIVEFSFAPELHVPDRHHDTPNDEFRILEFGCNQPECPSGDNKKEV